MASILDIIDEELSGVSQADKQQEPQAESAAEPPPDWSPENEQDFQEWYKGWSAETGLNPNPDDPQHFYDYRAAYKDGAYPQMQDDGFYHWPSQFKLEGHPRMVVDGVNTKTGERVDQPDAYATVDVFEGQGMAEPMQLGGLGNLFGGQEGKEAADPGVIAEQFGRKALRAFPRMYQTWNDLLYIAPLARPEETPAEKAQREIATGGGVSALTPPAASEDPKVRRALMAAEPEVRENVRLVSEYFPKVLERPNAPLVEQILTAPADFAVPMAVGAMSGGLGLGLTFMTSYGSAFEEFTSQGVDEQRARDAALFTAVTTTPIEYMGNMFEVGMMKAALGFAKKPVSAGAETLLSAVYKSAMGEGLEEFLQQYFEVAGLYYAANPNMKPEDVAKYIFDTFDKQTMEALKAGALGAASGALLTGAIVGGGKVLQEYAIKKDENGKLTSEFEKKLGLRPGVIQEGAEAGKSLTQILQEELGEKAEEFLPKPDEAIPAEMGAIPGEEAGASLTKEVSEEAAPEELQVIPEFATMEEAAQAGVSATEEEAEQFRELRQERLDEAEFYTTTQQHKAAAASIQEAARYGRALEAWEEPDRFQKSPDYADEVTPAQLTKIEKIITQKESEGFTEDELKDFLYDLGYDKEYVSKAWGLAHVPKLRKRGQGALRQPLEEVPGAIPPVYAGKEVPPVVVKTYSTGKKRAIPDQNIIVQTQEKPGRVIMGQFKSELMGEDIPEAKRYFDKLYKDRPGYLRPGDFWELPTWITVAAKSFNDADMLTVRDVKSAAKQVKGAGYEAVLFSSVDLNRNLIKEFAQEVGPGVRVVIGGYADKNYFKDTPNVEWYDSIDAAADALGYTPKKGVDVRHFKDTETMPRLCLSQGCLHKCAFCTIPKGITAESKESVDEQVESMKGLKFRLVYLNDKTFGQADNYKDLPEIYERIKKFNPEFIGFVVQTTAPQTLKFTDQYLQDSHIAYVELGVESYNDDILAKVHKPARTKTIDAAVEKLRANNIAFIPNVMVGLAGKGWEETKESYQNTLDFLYKNDDIISHVNVYNFAPYAGTELGSQLEQAAGIETNENAIARSYHKNPKLHEDFYMKVLKYGERQLSKNPFEQFVGGEAQAQVSKDQLSIFKEKKKTERRVEKWITTKDEVIIDEETGEKIKAGALTPEAEEKLNKAGVKTGAGPFPANSNFLVSITEEKGGLIYGPAKRTDEKTTRTKDFLHGKETITEYWRKIGGKTFKVLNTTILPRRKEDRVKLIDKYVSQFKKETEWYVNWAEYMKRFAGPQYPQEKIDKLLMIQSVLSAGASPQGAQTAFGKVMNVLEEYGSVKGGKGKGITENMALKINKIWTGEIPTSMNLAEYQDQFGRKIGAMVFSALHPTTKEGAVVVDRHMARMWGYNVMWGGAFRVPKHLQAEITQDVVDAAKRADLPIPAVQAALWYATGAGHWGSATHFEESIKLAPKKSLSWNMINAITMEPQAIVTFHGRLFYQIHGAEPPKALTKDELKRLGDLQEKARSFSTLGTSGLTGEEDQELLALQSKREGTSPNPWSKNDVQARMDASTEDNPYVSLGYWYGPGVRRESFYWSMEPHLTMIYENEIYDASVDKLGYVDQAWERAHNDTLVKKGERSADQVFINALAGLVKRSGDFKGFSIEPNGNTQVLTFDDMMVEEHPREYTVALSDRVSGIVKLPEKLDELAAASAEPTKKLLAYVEKELKNYPVKIVSYAGTLARIDESTSGETEYGLSLKVKGPITAVRAAFSQIIGLQKRQNMVLIFTNGAGGKMVRFRFASDDLAKIDKAIRKFHVHDFNVKYEKGGWWFETFVPTDLESDQEVIDNLVALYKRKGVEGTLEDSPVGVEALTKEPSPEALGATDYKSHVLKYFGKKKGAEIYDRAVKAGDEWAATSFISLGTDTARAGKQDATTRKGRGVLDSFGQPEGEGPGAEALLGPTERDVITVRDYYGQKLTVNVLINPSATRVEGFLSRTTYGEARMLLGPDGQFYVWDAADAIHYDVGTHYYPEWDVNEDYRFNAHKETLRYTLSNINELFQETFPDSGPLFGSAEALLGGKFAEGMPDSALGRAQVLKTNGATDTDIWRQTGWVLGPDDLWRFEIDDTPSRFVTPVTSWLDQARKANGNVKLGDILQHPDLYKFYPDAKDINVEVRGGIGSNGYYDVTTDTIVINSRQFKKGNDYIDFIETAFHEIQHYIQYREGFALGTSPEIEALRLAVEDPKWWTYSDEKREDLAGQAYWKNLGEIEASDVEDRLTWLTALERRQVVPLTGVRATLIPRDQWIIRRGPGKVAFAIDINQAPTRTMDYFARGAWKANSASQAVKDGLEISGISKFPEVMSKLNMMLTPFRIPPKVLKRKSLESWARQLHIDVETLEQQIASGERPILALTNWTDPLHAAITLSLELHRLPGKRLQHSTLHEVWHIIEEWFLPKEVLDVLKQAYPGGSEARAERYADYMTGRLMNPPSKVEEWFARLTMFFKYLRSKLLGLEFSHPNEIFEWMRRGYFKSRWEQRQQEVSQRITRASTGLLADLDDMERGPANVVSEATIPPLEFDDEKTGRQRVKQLSDEWMRGGAEASLADAGWTPEKGQAHAGDDRTIPKIIELPEMLQIYRNLMQGKLPGVRERLFGRDSIRGVFIPGRGIVRLKAEIFRNPDLAARVLAHEIGHVIDWLPDQMLGGNILGKIASIRDFVRDTLPFKPGAPGELTHEDVKRLREEAVKLLGLTQILRTKWIDTTLTEDLKITPEDILAIWNSVMDQSKVSPELYRYIQGLDSNAKKLIIKAALKGQLSPEVQNFIKTVKVGAKTKKQVTEVEYVPPTQEQIAKKLRDLIEKEIRLRKLWVEEEVRDELKTLSSRWRPFDPSQATQSFINYRWSSEELYADAISALFNDPQFLKAQAPKFYEAFFNYLQKKPDVMRIYMNVQMILHSGAVDEARTLNYFRMFDEGDDAYAKQYEDIAPNIPDSFKRAFFDSFHFIVKDVRKVGDGNIPVDDNPRYKLEQMTYTGSEIEAFMTDIYHNVVKPLEKVNLRWNREFGLIVLLRRIIHDRDKMANPGGFDYEKAVNKIEAMRTSELTDVQWAAMKEAVKNFREIHERYFIDKAEQAQVYDDATIKLFRDNTAYATFDVMPYLIERYGRAVATRVYKQVGTLQDIPNPATATMMKDIAFIKAVNKNIAARSVVKFYSDYAHILGIQVEEARRVWNGRFRSIQEPKDPSKGLVVYLYKGKAYGYYLPKEIADAINENHTPYTMTARIFRWLSTPFRKIFTELNYGFWIFNLLRDWQRFYAGLPGMNPLTFAKYWLAGLKPSFRSTFGIADPVAQEMQQNNMLISVADYRGLLEEDEQLERLMKMYHLKPNQVYKKRFLTPFGHLFNFIGNRARLAEWYFTGVGRAFERTTKVATYKYLTEKFPDMPMEVVGHIVRTRGGSPDFLRAGREQQLYNNILLFSNAMKEGYRGDVESLKENPAQFITKKLMFVFIPKLLMYAGLMGFLGSAIKEIFDGVTEYDLTNYLIIPLGRTVSGKVVYWRVPTDETSRFLGGVLWKILRTPELGVTEQVGALFDYMAGQAPTLTPGVSVLTDVVQYASGQNPYDHFYGRHAVGDLEFQAQDRRAHFQFLQYLASKMGASVVYKFKHDKVEKIGEELESILGFPVTSKVGDFMVEAPDAPVVSNILGRFLKVTDYGVREDILRDKQKIRRENARGILDAREAAYDIVDGKMPEPENLLALAQKPDVANRQMMLALARKYGMVYFEEWLTAGTNAERFAVLQKMMEKNALAKQDAVGLVTAPEQPTPEPEQPSQYPPLSVKDLVEKEAREQ